jgi:hypothetical protein
MTPGASDSLSAPNADATRVGRAAARRLIGLGGAHRGDRPAVGVIARSALAFAAGTNRSVAVRRI